MKNKYPDLWLFFYLFSRSIFLISILSLAGIFWDKLSVFLKLVVIYTFLGMIYILLLK